MHPGGSASVCLAVILLLAAAHASPTTHASVQPGSQLTQHMPAQHSRRLLQKKYVLSPDPDHKDCFMYRASTDDSVPAIAKALGVSESDLRTRNSANIQDFSRLNGRFLQICNIKNFGNAEGPNGAPITPGSAGKPLSAAATAPAAAPAPAPAPAPAAAPAPAPKTAAAPAPGEASGTGIGLPFGVRPGGVISPLGGFGLGRRRK